MHSFRLLRAAFAGAALLATTAARAGDLDGVYENTGSLVAAATPDSGTISFQGLLELNFDYTLTRALHGATNRVTIRETATHFKIECLDADDHVTWTGSWEKGAGCTTGDDRVDLTFHNSQLKYDSYVLSLQPVPQRDLLLVDVKRLNATLLGPSVQPVGTFVFGRLANR